MSEQRLKDLIDELVDDVPRPDAHRVDAAWSSARRRRRRGASLAAAGAVVVTVVATTAVAVGIRYDDDAPTPGGGTPSPSTSETPGQPTRPDRPDARYQGVPVWWAPPPKEDSGLEWFDSVLPRTVDLAPGRPPVEPGDRALAVFTMHDVESGGPERLVALTPDGETWDLPADHVEANRDEDGNAGSLTPHNGGLSPDGRHLLLAQPSSIELYDFETGEWTTIDTPDWMAEGARWLDPGTIWVPRGMVGSGIGTTYDAQGRLLDPEVPRLISDLDVAAADEPYGVWVDAPGAVAGSYFFSGPIDGGPYSNPEGLVARVGDERSILAVSVAGRGKGCCPVVGWLDDGVVAFEAGAGRVLAWRVGTGTLYRVSEATGFDVGTEAPNATWAWQALR